MNISQIIFCCFFRIFIYLVNKTEIFDFLMKDMPEIKDQKEIVLLHDGIIPQLHKNLEKNELCQTYPLRGMLIYDTQYKDGHVQ